MTATETADPSPSGRRPTVRIDGSVAQGLRPTAIITVRMSSATAKRRNVRYRVLVDGGKVGALKPGRAVDIPVPRGRHEVWVTAGRRAACRAIEVSVDEGQPVVLQCHPSAVSLTTIVGSILRRPHLELRLA
ncbi:MAG TPA: hypothetical protein VFH70_07640 [Acidimicrobiales bacterium]|nr:hypothetical protein [Acidimicrobiales bacterium]